MTRINRSLHAGTREELEARLREARSRLLRTVAMTEEELATLESREPGAAIEDAAREETMSLLARLGHRERQEVEELDAASARLADGTYGVCEGCGGTIPVARLRAMPAARRCVACQIIRE